MYCDVLLVHLDHFRNNTVEAMIMRLPFHDSLLVPATKKSCYNSLIMWCAVQLFHETRIEASGHQTNVGSIKLPLQAEWSIGWIFTQPV